MTLSVPFIYIISVINQFLDILAQVSILKEIKSY